VQFGTIIEEDTEDDAEMIGISLGKIFGEILGK